MEKQDCHIRHPLPANVGTGEGVEKKIGNTKLHRVSHLKLNHVLCLSEPL